MDARSHAASSLPELGPNPMGRSAGGGVRTHAVAGSKRRPRGGARAARRVLDQLARLAPLARVAPLVAAVTAVGAFTVGSAGCLSIERPAAVTCEPACVDRECGDDGCGGVCGACPAAAPYCNEGVCSAECLPACGGNECGDDGCGGSCGTCPPAAPECVAGLCALSCTPACGARECGDDGCGGSCGTCPPAAPECVAGLCATVCLTACADRECGDDGCGGSCGTCPGAAPYCIGGLCATSCVPTCGGKECGGDGCGGSCGTCPAAAAYCVGGLCSADCVPACEGRQCGEDGCGGSCGACPASAPHCYDGMCSAVCVPVCGAGICGDDGCGGSCGECAEVPQLSVQPSLVDFGAVSLGVQETKAVNIQNVGAAPLVVSGFALTGHQGFSLAVGAKSWSAAEAAAGVWLDEPLTVAAGEAATVVVRFEPSGPEGAEGTLAIHTNDPAWDPAFPLGLQANQSGPCIALSPKKVDFGGRIVGEPAVIAVTIISCGEEPLEIGAVHLAEGGSPDFSLDLGGLPGVAPGTASLAAPLPPVVLAPNETATFEVGFVPAGVNPIDATGTPLFDLGIVHLTTDAFVPHVEVELKGFGVEFECPTAVIKVQEGEEVIPQTKPHLIGSESYAAEGPVAKHQWSVDQPIGSMSVFLPSATAPDPTFEANVAGTYVFRLDVWSETGEASCMPAEYTVFVNPDEAIHVELLWSTPNDEDQTDEGPEAGADLDLHFRHPYATGEDVDGDGKPDGWFDQPFDCFWFNPHPNWGSLDPLKDDDPGLDRDDTDGAGPENVNLNIPEDGLTYDIGVHYWNDHGYGPSAATLRLYIYSSLVFQVSDVQLANHDLWQVATVAWPSGKVQLTTDESGSYEIIPNYKHPFFFEP